MEGSTEYQEWTGAILAGGRARRFGGRDKGSLIVEGRAIVSRQLAALFPVTSRQFIVANDVARYVAYGVAVVPDLVEGVGPLGGLYTALRTATTPALLAVACDMPFVTTGLLSHLASRLGSADAVVPRANGGRHVLCAAFATRTADTARAALAAGRYAVADFLEELTVVEVSPADLEAFDDTGLLLANVNTEEDYRRVLGAASAPTSA